MGAKVQSAKGGTAKTRTARTPAPEAPPVRVGKQRTDPPAPATEARTVPASRHPNAGKTYFELARMRPRDLQKVFDAGVTPTFAELVGWEFRGWNPPAFARVLGFQKFKKGFFLDAGQSVDGAAISGYNVFVRQNWLDDPHLARPSEDRPRRHGFFLVTRVEPGSKDGKHPHALLLDYGRGKNAPYNPERVIRDYLVRVDPDNPDLFLGKAYLALGPLRVFSNFFILDRYNRVDEDLAGR